MTVVRALYERFQKIIHEFAKFGVIGVIGLAITNAGYAVFHGHFQTGPVTATTIATIIATCVTYVGNRYWSFRHRERTNVAREGLTFFLLNGIGLLIQDAVVAFNFYVLSMGHDKVAEFVALNCGIALATLFRFWSYRRFVWAAKPAAATAAAVGGETVVPDPPEPTSPNGRYSPTQAAAGNIGHVNGHDPAGQAAGEGSFSRR